MTFFNLVTTTANSERTVTNCEMQYSTTLSRLLLPAQHPDSRFHVENNNKTVWPHCVHGWYNIIVTLYGDAIFFTGILHYRCAASCGQCELLNNLVDIFHRVNENKKNSCNCIIHLCHRPQRARLTVTSPPPYIQSPVHYYIQVRDRNTNASVVFRVRTPITKIIGNNIVEDISHIWCGF